MSFLAEVCKGSDPPNPLTSLSNKPLACLASSGLMKSILNREKSFIVTPMPNTKSYSNCLLEPIVITYQNKYYLEGTKISVWHLKSVQSGFNSLLKTTIQDAKMNIHPKS